MRTTTGHGENDNNALFRANFKLNAPITYSATNGSIGSFKKLYIAIIRIGAHVLESFVDMLEVGARDLAKVTCSGLSYFEASCHVSIDRAK